MTATIEWLTTRAERLACRVLNRHHYASCRGRRDHGPAVDHYGYPTPARR